MHPEGEELDAPGLMSFTSTVPFAVPSVFQSSNPEAPSLAAKYSAPLNTVNPKGAEPPDPGLISFTRAAPALPPSFFQTSPPATPPVATNNSPPSEPAEP